MKTKYLLFSLILFHVSCKDENSILKQKIFFEKHYINLAMIPQSSGFLIDSLGNVLEFKWVEVFHEWYEPDSTGYITSENMDKNISICQNNNFQINPDSLKIYVDKIYAASKGNISKPQHIITDAWTSTFSAFIFDKKTNRYKQVMIKTEGDFSINNSSSDAEKIYQWLIRIGK